MTPIENLRHRQGLASLLLLVPLLASGCSAPSTGGQSGEAATAQIQAISGVEEAYVDGRGSWNGLTREAGTLVFVWLSPGFRVQRTHELAEFLVRLAWSVNTEKPNSDLVFQIDGSEMSQLESALTDAGWEFRSRASSGFMFIPPAVVGAKLGRWPGPVPVTPDNMIVPVDEASATPSHSAPLLRNR